MSREPESALARKDNDMPFGLDLKTMIITVLFLYLVLPMIMRFVSSKQTKKA